LMRGCTNPQQLQQRFDHAPPEKTTLLQILPSSPMLAFFAPHPFEHTMPGLTPAAAAMERIYSSG